MLHELSTDQLRIGMYVKSMDCSWLTSPFWRRQFKISSRADIDSLNNSGVTSVTIDDTKGAGPAVPEAPVPAPANDATMAPAAPMADQHRPRRKRAPSPSEVDRARETVERSRVAVTAMFNEARMGNAVQTAIVGPLVDDISASVARDAGAMLKVTRLKSKNEYTYLHSVAVCALMINLARRLDLPEADARRIGMAGLLHDIGKMAVPDTVLDKPGALDDAEWRAIRNHPEAGHTLLSGSEGIDALALDVCLHHHERIDGRGYPLAKKAEEISIYARMGAICDVYDAVTSNRPYKTSWSPNEALAKMLEWEGHFDPDILAAFIDSIGIPPLGGLVRLQSNRLAVTVGANDEDPTAPLVRAFYSIPDQAMLPLEDVVTDGDDAADPIIQMERGDYWFGPSWPDVLASVADNRAPAPSEFAPARPYGDCGHTKGASIRSVIDAIERDKRRPADDRPVRIAPRPRRWLSGWIAGEQRARPADASPTMATVVARHVFNDIGEFLFAHELSLTATNLDIVLRYVSGSDQTVAGLLGALLHEHGRITDAMIERIAGEAASRSMSPEIIHGLADRLQGRLDECVGLVARSSESASSYGSAFDAGMARLDAGHADALSELSATARDLVRTTRDMQGELNRHRHETSRLRGELQRARRDAERDHLTGLPNRRCFDARVKAACEPGGTFVVALCDIDNFKAINDEHGHSTGDRVLRLVGAHLDKELKGKALVARHGGEEFALFFPRLGVAAAAAAIDETRQRLAARVLIDQESRRALRQVTFSAGVALLNGDVGTAMRAADHALYRAKDDGKNRVVLSDAAVADGA